MHFELTHAIHDRLHCLAPGLFRSLKKGDRGKEKLNILCRSGEYDAQFVGFEPLAVDDLRFLQGIVAMAGRGKIPLPPSPTDAIQTQLRDALNTQNEAVCMDGLFVKCKSGRLLREIGMSDGGENIRSFKNSLKRLSNVTVFLTKHGRTASFHLLSFYFDSTSREFAVALNPWLARAVFGTHTHSRIEMSEVRRLKSDAARLLHQRLCGFIDPGRSRKVSLLKLCSYVWFTNPESKETLRQRQVRLYPALEELKGCGWTVTETSKGSFTIARPKNPLPEFSAP